jgi:hypothetical protein
LPLRNSTYLKKVSSLAEPRKWHFFLGDEKTPLKKKNVVDAQNIEIAN